MVIKDLLEYASKKLKNLEYTNEIDESIIILSKLIDKDISYIYTNLDKRLKEDTKNKYIEYIDKRSKGYPVAYLFNEKRFYDLDLYVDEGVLIPRPETEILIDYVLDYNKKHYTNKNIKVLDIGCGSGAIALSIAKHCKNCKVTGIDISEKALEVSETNKYRNNISNVEFIKSDLFSNIDNKEDYDIIISNPPYIESKNMKGLQKDVIMYEPKLALDGGEDGLDYYRRIIKESRKHLQNKGLICFEIGFNQGELVREILKKYNYIDIEVRKDLQGHDRIVSGKKN